MDKIIADGDLIELGETRLRVLETPGHTAGSSSYIMQVREGGRDYNVAIANMGTINAGKQLVVDPTYPGVADDFAETFRKQKALEVDVWVAAHGGQYGLHGKYEVGQDYSPDTFVDPEGFLTAVERLEKLYLLLVRPCDLRAEAAVRRRPGRNDPGNPGRQPAPVPRVRPEGVDREVCPCRFPRPGPSWLHSYRWQGDQGRAR